MMDIFSAVFGSRNILTTFQRTVAAAGRGNRTLFDNLSGKFLSNRDTTHFTKGTAFLAGGFGQPSPVICKFKFIEDVSNEEQISDYQFFFRDSTYLLSNQLQRLFSPLTLYPASYPDRSQLQGHMFLH